VTTVQELVAGRYRLESRVAIGGMGAVWRAHDELLGRTVALKLLSDELAHDPRAAARFRREARTAASLSHPRMANVFDLVEEGGRPGIVMEFCESETLSARLLRSKRLPIPEAARIADSLLDALDGAHRNGVVHRDVKPGNILLCADGDVKITDFGIALSLGDSSLTQTGTIMGTAAYASPEQVGGTPATPASDLYAAGIVLYEMLTGARPFTGDSAVAVALARLSVQPAPPSSLRPSIPAEMDAVVMRALARDPAERFASANEMRAALNHAAAAAAAVAPRAAIDERPLVAAAPLPPVAPVAPAGATSVLRLSESDPTLAMGSGPRAQGAPLAGAAARRGERARRRERTRHVVPPVLARQLGIVLAPLAIVAVVATLAAATVPGGDSAAARATPSPPACCAVPRLIGHPLDNALARLKGAHLVAGTVTKKVSSYPPGTVIGQSSAPGATVSQGGSVDLVIATSPPPPPAPARPKEHRHKHHGHDGD
jgi:hypothetical protein